MSLRFLSLITITDYLLNFAIYCLRHAADIDLFRRVFAITPCYFQYFADYSFRRR